MLLFMDSFDHYGIGDVLEKWTTLITLNGSTLTLTSAAGRRGSVGARCTYASAAGNPGQAQLGKTLSASGATCVVGMALKTDVAPTSAGTAIMQIFDGATAQLSLVLQSDMRLQVKRGQVGGTNVGSPSATSLNLNQAYYIEWKVLIDPTVGTAEVRVNEVPIITLTGQNTRASALSQWSIVYVGLNTTLSMAGGTGLEVDVDDVYMCDGSGAAPWNTFLGDCRVDVRRPTAAGATTGWTPLAGANWDAVNDATPDDDATYTEAATVGLTDTFVTENAPVATAAILGVQHCLAMKKTDAGTASVAPVIRHSGVDYPGAAIALATTYGYSLGIAATNPGTSAAWVETDFNNAEFGYTRTA